MALSFPRTFANLTSALLSYLDDNFNYIKGLFGAANGFATLDSNGNLVEESLNTKSVAQSDFQVAFGVGTTIYNSIYGTGDQSATEDNAKAQMPMAGTISKLYVRASFNTLTTADTVVTLRLNKANTALTVTIPAGSTSAVTDLAHSVSFAAGDYLDWQAAVAAGGSGQVSGLRATALVTM